MGGTEMPARVSADFHRQLEGYGLTLAEIFYYNPDAKRIINPHTYTWQEYDLFPEFPNLKKFLAFWKHEVHGPAHSVRIAHARLIKPAEFKVTNGVMLLN